MRQCSSPSFWWKILGRNKKAITLNLKADEGREVGRRGEPAEEGRPDPLVAGMLVDEDADALAFKAIRNAEGAEPSLAVPDDIIDRLAFDPTIIVIILIGAVILARVQAQGRERADTAISALWAVGMATGIVLIDLAPGYNVDILTDAGRVILSFEHPLKGRENRAQ